MSHRKMYKLPRSPVEIRINNYNPLLLLLWKANMDLQFVGECTLAIAQYVTGYVTKAEKSNMQELWQEVSSHNSVYSKLKLLVGNLAWPDSYSRGERFWATDVKRFV